MKCKYKIYENSSVISPELDTKISEQLLIAEVERSYVQPQRIVLRPKEKVWKDVLILAITAAVIIASLIALNALTDISAMMFVLICLMCVLAYIAIFANKLLLTVITLYQKYAPEFVRSSCLFEPCCSEYMKKAIKKYGALKGFIKGIKRISLCHYPNGGIDEP